MEPLRWHTCLYKQRYHLGGKDLISIKYGKVEEEEWILS